MLEVVVWLLLVGNLGWQAVVVSRWLRWQQVISSQQEQEEEEILTRFQSKEDSASTKLPKPGRFKSPDSSHQESTDQQLVGWEFKIVRASRDLFHDPAIFRQLCEEEASAGWILLEKLDNRRVRFKRLIALRDFMDGQQLDYDPYRSHYGTSLTPLHWLGAIATVSVVLLPLYLGYSLISTRLKPPQPNLPESTYEEIPPQDFPPVQEDEE